jgi:deoxyadenosine/deoxycytidine kinase
MRVSIGGSIGCGKSSILQKLKENGFDVFFEPVDEWKHLKQFYLDKKRWGFTFQVEVLSSFQKCKNTSSLVVCERSPWESYHIFSQTLAKSGDMSIDEYELFNKIYESLYWKPDIFIYLRATPEICMSRIHQRNRPCEQSINMEYLQDLHVLYEGLFTRGSISIDASKSIQSVYDEVIKTLNNLKTQ